MRIFGLSNDLAKPCYVINFRGVRVMLDCGLTEKTVLNFLPLALVPSAKLMNLPNWKPREPTDAQIEGELKENCGRVFIDSSPEFACPLDKLVPFCDIDVILISNYMNMLALPFITEGTGFRGRVYATEPTLQIGRFFLEELVEYIETAPKTNTSNAWKDIINALPAPLGNAFRADKWRGMFSMKEINNSLGRVTVMGYDQKCDIYGAFTATPVSSGFCLGSSNWVLTTAHEKVCYVSGSSTLTTHPRPINQIAIKHADILILTGLTQEPTVNPDTKLGELCMNVAVTIRNNGSVLIPCYPSGVVYDLFECLTQNLENAGLNNVPMFFISPVADCSLAYSNILAEWLSSSKQNKVYIPEDPFPHAKYMRSSLLKHFKHVYSEGFSREFRQPCVVFCGHPSLRFGDSVHFVEMWGNNPNNSIIFTEPDFPYLQALAPFQPLAMKAFYCPIDTALNYQQANKLIKELKPNILIVPDAYTKPPSNAPHLTIDHPERRLVSVSCGEVLRLPIKHRLDRVYMSADMAKRIRPHDYGNGIMLSTVTGELKGKDNIFDLKPINEVFRLKGDLDDPPTRSEVLHNARNHYGRLETDPLMKRLMQDGMKNIKLDRVGNTLTYHLINEDIMVEVANDEHKTHVYFPESKDAVRLKIRNSLMKLLRSF